MNTPKIRFKGFTDDWEQRKVGEFLTESRESGHKGDIAHKMTVKLWGKGVYEKKETGSANTQYFTRHAGQFIYSKLDFLNCAFGVVPEELENLETTADVPAFDCDGVNPYFMFYTAIQPRFYEKNGMIADGSRKAKRIHADTFLDMPFFVPSLKEQNKIVNLLSELDNLITLHQRKCDETKQLKKFMLQKMFPKNGEKNPKIRFEGFTDDWEQRKVGDQMYIKSRIGWQALTKQEYLSEGDYYLITGTDIDETTHRVDLKRSYYVSKERYEMDSKIQVKEGDIIVTKDGTIGKVAMVTGLDKPATLNSHLFVLRDMSGKLDNHFLLHILNSHMFNHFVKSTKTGSTLTGLPQKTFVEFAFSCPKYEEQKLLSNYFDRLDHLIALHQRKCEKLKALKKFMLQNMFI